MDKQNEIDLEKDLDLLFDEDFDFKPITKGLGFHHSIKEKKEIKSSLKLKQAELKDQLDNRSKTLNQKKVLSKAASMGDLAPFYEEQKKESISLDINEVTKVQTEKISDSQQIYEVSMFARMGAWILDMIIVVTLFTVSFIAMMFASNTSLELVKGLLMTTELFITVMPIFGIFYIFYFSFFDKTTFSTPGKRIAGIKVVNSKDQNISMLQALMRTLITVVSTLTVGLLVILDAQSKITDTKVIRR